MAASRRSRRPSPRSAPQQVRSPVWQKPSCWWTVKRSVSRSQSTSTASSSWTAPDVSPLTHLPRERLWYTPRRVSMAAARLPASDQANPRAKPPSSVTTVGHSPSIRSDTSTAATASASPIRPVYSAMPTWASAPMRSRAAISSAVVIPPAMVTGVSPAAATTASARARSVPARWPSRSTKVTRNPPHSGRSSPMRAIRSPAGGTSPPVAEDHTVPGVERHDHAVAGEGGEQLGRCRGPDDHPFGTSVEPAPGGGDVADAATDPDPGPGAQLGDQRLVGALAPGGIDVHHRHLADHREAVEDRPGVTGLQRQRLAFDQLDGPATARCRWTG